MKKVTILVIGFITLFAAQAMAQETADATEVYQAHYQAMQLIIDYEYSFISFVIILGLKFIKNRRIPDSANFIPFFMGLVHAILEWVWFYRTAVMGHPDRMVNISLEIIAFGSIFTVLLITVDIVRSLIKPKKRKKTSEPIK